MRFNARGLHSIGAFYHPGAPFYKCVLPPGAPFFRCVLTPGGSVLKVRFTARGLRSIIAFYRPGPRSIDAFYSPGPTEAPPARRSVASPPTARTEAGALVGAGVLFTPAVQRAVSGGWTDSRRQ